MNNNKVDITEVELNQLKQEKKISNDSINYRKQEYADMLKGGLGAELRESLKNKKDEEDSIWKKFKKRITTVLS